MRPKMIRFKESGNVYRLRKSGYKPIIAEPIDKGFKFLLDNAQIQCMLRDGLIEEVADED